MCSIGDDNFDEIENVKYMPVNGVTSESDKCNKCRQEKPSILLRSKDKYCKKCFIAGTVHKFKALLGKHKLIRPNDLVLVVHKCGHATTALLHFLRTGLDLETHKKLRFQPLILFIDDHLHLSEEERANLVHKVKREVDYFKFPLYLTSISQLITTPIECAITTQPDLLHCSDNDKNVLNKFLEKQTNKTKKHEFLNIKMRQYLINIAKYLNCKFVFTPEISAHVASQILTDLSLGRGPHIPLNTGFCDSRDEAVKILRPLRLFDAKELAFYNYLHKLEPVTFRITAPNPYESIQFLTNKFVNDLQVNYPATVTTILKTGDKLALDPTLSSKCVLCQAPIEGENTELTADKSTQFSHWISQTLNSTECRTAVLTKTCDNYCFSCKMLIKQV